MNNSQETSQGFTPHVLNQLEQMATVPTSDTRNRGTGRGRGRRGKPHYQPLNLDQHQSSARHSGWNGNQTTVPLQGPHMNHNLQQSQEVAAFPALGSTTSIQQTNRVQMAQSSQQPYLNAPSNGQYQQHGNRQPHPLHEHHQRGRHNGRYGGRARGGHAAHGHHQSYSSDANQFHRPQHSQGRLYNPGESPYFGTAEQQQAYRHKTISQSDFLGTLASKALQNQISEAEFREKEAFRKVIQNIAQQAITTHSTTSPESVSTNVKLKLYGSLGSGFGVAGSDMDLLLTFPQNGELQDGIEIDSRRWLEKGLLDAGYGARLLTNTRVPILKVCERPNPELLANLRENRQQWEDSVSDDAETAAAIMSVAPLPLPLPPSAAAEILDALEKISLEAAEIPLPDAGPADQARLEFGLDCGIQCDINFTNYVALRNTELLRVYGQCDARVRQVGLFVKNWAKARDINTPYKGTLSSYGYIMMVLHYLMNVVQPPILPNLQAIAKDQDAWARKTQIELVEGYDVRFVRDPTQLHEIMAKMRPNHESLGSLLRGFFWYYACNGGFHWTRDAISIRNHGGRVSKHSKGWTGAKWSESKQNVRLRYLLAIEDPFETEHNIGRTVGHSGIVAIRDEFRRAWSIIESVQLDEIQRVWVWRGTEGSGPRNAEELMEKVENRGDLLRKDQIAHKERMRQMRQEAEAQEQSLRDTPSEGGETISDALDDDGVAQG